MGVEARCGRVEASGCAGTFCVGEGVDNGADADIDAVKAEAGEGVLEDLVMHEDDVVTVGKEDDPADIKLISEGMVCGIWIRAPEFARFMGGHQWAMAFEFEVEGKEGGLHVGENGTEDEKPHVY